ncbi:zinc dependent phospholipase C family protein [Roseivirga sp. BDSF3-8]|uniref:zinc dependent phospholipase C family protein n=1 Tax=Roseivirga sp. BDSF3-8 TaxID=3241598 RepID=UPI0035322570
MKKILSILLVMIGAAPAMGWGFMAHRKINHQAVFSLPPELFVFYKRHIRYITENAVNPDQRRYAVEWEAPRHFIDLDKYGDSAAHKLPRYWKEAAELYGEDTLNAHGIVPWHINRMYYQLKEAFENNDARAILRLSADVGHYIADAHVPLHTTSNYNGQLTGQHGIHGFWESRLPELFAEDYDFFVGKADYLMNTQESAWQAVISGNEALDSVLLFEKELTMTYGDEKYSYEERGSAIVKTYNRNFSTRYHEALAGQVERQMQASIKLVADMWYTCWVDAGQPDMGAIAGFEFSEKEKHEEEERKKSWLEAVIFGREHEH